MFKCIKIKVAGEQNVAIISSSWCVNRSGICLSFAIPIEVLSITQIEQYGKEFMRAVNQSYQELLEEYFYEKTDSPIISATSGGQIIMMWSFQGDNNKNTKERLQSFNIKQIKYN